MKKALAILGVTFALLFQTVNTTYASSIFADIDTVPWAEAGPIMEKAYEYGLLSGYVIDDVRYAKPNSQLAYSEATQLAYSIMSVYTGETTSDAILTKWSQVMKAYEIPSWLQPAASYCMEMEFLNPEHLSKLKNDTYKVTREEVGVLFGKALASVFEIEKSPTLTYNDKDSFSADSVPYIDLLYRYEIMIGDQNGNFRPDDKINRAEVAVFTVRAFETIVREVIANSKPEEPEEPEKVEEGTLSGQITSVETLSNGDIFVSLLSVDGVAKNLTASATTATIKYLDSVVNVSDVGIGDVVTLNYEGNVATEISITASSNGILQQQDTYEFEGFTSSKIIVIDEDGEKVNFSLGEDVIVYLNTSKSSYTELSTASSEDNYIVTLKFDDDNCVTRIDAMKSSNNPLKGDLSKLTNSKVTITIGSKDYEYYLDDSVVVKYLGSSYLFSKLADEYSDSNAEIQIKLNSSGYVYEIEIVDMDSETSGTIERVTSKALTLLAKGESYAYSINSDAKVTLDGKSIELSEIINSYEDTNYKVSLIIDSYDNIATISVTTKYKDTSTGSLYYIDEDTIKIKIDDIIYHYDVNKEITAKIDDSNVSKSTLLEGYKGYDITVDLSFNEDNEVVSIIGINNNPYEGILKNVEPSLNRITLTTLGVNYNYSYDEDKTVIKVNNVVCDDLNELDDIFGDALWSKKDITAVLTLENNKIDTLDITIEDSESYVGSTTVVSEFYSYSDDEIKVRVTDNLFNTKTYSIDFSELEDNDELKLNYEDITASKLKSIFDDYSIEDFEVLELKLIIDSSGEIQSLNAFNLEEKVTKGYLKALDTENLYIQISSDSDLDSIWSLNNSCKFTFNVDEDDYNENDYDSSVESLYSLLSDAKKNDDEVYITLSINTLGKVTAVTAKTM